MNAQICANNLGGISWNVKLIIVRLIGKLLAINLAPTQAPFHPSPNLAFASLNVLLCLLPVQPPHTHP